MVDESRFLRLKVEAALSPERTASEPVRSAFEILGRPLRLCMLNEFFYPDMLGGTGTVVSDLARALSEDPEIQVEAITSRRLYRDGSVRLNSTETWDRIKIRRVDAPNFNRASTVKRAIGNMIFAARVARKMLRGPRYDVVFVTTAPPFLPMAARLYQMLTGTPFVYLLCDVEPDRAIALGAMNPNSLPARGLGWLQRRWMKAANQVIAIGRCMKEHIATVYNVSEDKVTVIESGANDSQVVPSTKETEFRHENGIEGFVALYSGNFGKYHDMDVILDAAKIVAQTRSDVIFALVGNGAKERLVRDRIAAEGLTNVRVLPFVPSEQLSDMLASADVSLVTLEEGALGLCVPSKFYTALASARPVIAVMNPRCEVALTVEESSCGFVVEPGDAAELAKRVLELAQSPEEAVLMGDRGRRVLSEKYSTVRLSARYRELVLAVCKPRRRSDARRLRQAQR